MTPAIMLTFTLLVALLAVAAAGIILKAWLLRD
jgi:hypothetical protein